jgi:predicted nucleic acid-binding protein
MKDNFIIDFGIENKFDGIISADKDLLEYKTDKIKIMNINN